MYKKLLLFILCLGTMGLNAQIKTPAPSPSSKLIQSVGLTEVTLEYSRPAMKGRTIFGDLVPYDKMWRTGANANTKITFGDDVVIEGDTLAKGTYAIFTKPSAETWEIIFYNDASNWGTPRNWDDGKVALKTTAKVQSFPNKIETFTMTFDDLTSDSGVLGLLWENTYIGVKFNVPTDAIASKSINDVMSGPSANDYFSSASYYRNTDRDLNQALTWINKATEMNKKAYWMMREKSLILAAMGDKKSAIAAATKSLQLAEESGNADYVKMNTEAIAAWSK